MKRSLGMRGLVVSTAMSMLLAPVLITAAHAAPTIPCTSASLLYLVGSGENNVKTPELEAYGAALEAKYPSLESRKIDYPAASVVDLMDGIDTDWANVYDPTNSVQVAMASLASANRIRGLIDSVNKGAANAVAEIKDTITQCPNQKLVLAGYSQGAMALHAALAQLNSQELTHIAGAIFLGDPWFNEQGYMGFATTFAPIAHVLFPGDSALAQPTPYVPDALKDRYITWCRIGDPLCDVPFADSIQKLGTDLLNLSAVALQNLLDASSMTPEMQTEMQNLIADTVTTAGSIAEWVSWSKVCTAETKTLEQGNDVKSPTCQHLQYGNQREWDVDVAIRVLNSLPVPTSVLPNPPAPNPAPNPGPQQPTPTTPTTPTTSPDGTGCTTPDGGPGILQAGACT